MKTTGNTILITGAGTGVGLEAAKQLSKNGNTIIMVARNAERLKKEADKLQNAHAIPCDLSDLEDLTRLVANLKKNHKDLNMIFLNAGIAANYSLFEDADAYKTSIAEMTTNYHSAVYLTQALESLLAEKDDAAMLITTSGVVFAPDLLHPTYSATKAALHSYILSMRLVLERKKSSVKVFELVLPLVDSPFSSAVQSDLKMSPEKAVNEIVSGLEKNEFEMHIGLTKDIYEVYLKSPQQALQLVNNLTGEN